MGAWVPWGVWLNSLGSIVAEPVGSNCLVGGSRVTAGLDTNNCHLEMRLLRDQAAQQLRSYPASDLCGIESSVNWQFYA